MGHTDETRVRDTPEILLTAGAGHAISLSDLGTPRPVLLIFARPGDAASDTLLDDLPELARALHPTLGVTPVVDDARSSSVLDERWPNLAEHALYDGAPARVAFGIEKAPTAVLIGRAGPADHGPAVGLDEIYRYATALCSEAETPR